VLSEVNICLRWQIRSAAIVNGTKSYTLCCYKALEITNILFETFNAKHNSHVNITHRLHLTVIVGKN